METTITNRLNGILKDLISVGGTITADIASRDGLTIATLAENPGNREKMDEVCAMSATMYGAAETATLRLGLKLPTKVITETDSGHLIVIGAGPKALLVVMTRPDAGIGLILLEMKKAAKQVKEILG